MSSPSRRLVTSYGLFMGNAQCSTAGRMIPVYNPASPNDNKHLQVACGTAKDVAEAVTYADQAFQSGVWAQAPVQDRARVLHDIGQLLRKRLEFLAQLEVAQTGRPINEMRAQLGRLPEWFEYFAALIRTQEGRVPPFSGNYLNYVTRVPLGVVAQITPWNHPLLIAVKKLAPALAAGNSVVSKPSELAPCSIIELAGLCAEAGLPPGVLSVIPGLGPESGAALVGDPRVSFVDLTGGTSTGSKVAATAGHALTPCIAELGGKAPVVVFQDADLEEVVNGAAFAGFIASGQTCIMGSRLLIHESIFDEVVGQLAQKLDSLRIGDPMDTDTQLGPVISQHQLDRVEEFVQEARANPSVDVVCGGRRAPDTDGYFYQPTLLAIRGTHDTHALKSFRVVQEEVFGPVVVAYSFSDEDDAVSKANGTAFGLGAGIWTKDVKRAHRVASRINAGIIWVNDHHRNDPASPWGAMGSGGSGWGRENGIDALHCYSQTKSVIVNTSDAKFDWFSGANQRYS